MTGQFVVKGGGSMAGGKVLLFSAGDAPAPTISKFIRIPSLVVEIDPAGGFVARIPVGKFYLIALKRNSGMAYGRPQKGDFAFRYRDKDGRSLKEFTMHEGEHIDLGLLEALPWGQGKIRATAENTGIEGSITGVDGKPIGGLLVFAFTTPQMQKQKPIFISDKTDAKGRFILKVAGGHTYYLMARDSIGGGRVAEGGLIGVYGGRQPRGVSVKAGKTVRGVYFSVTKMHRGPAPAPDANNKTDNGTNAPTNQQPPSPTPQNPVQNTDQQAN